MNTSALFGELKGAFVRVYLTGLVGHPWHGHPWPGSNGVSARVC
jgi:hypothetical protein